MNTDGTEVTQTTQSPARDSYPVWSPTQPLIAFDSNRSGHWKIHIVGTDGGDPIQLTDSPLNEFTPAWSADGTQLAYTARREDDDNTDIYTMQADGTNIRQLTFNPEYDGYPTWSPDDTQIAFISERDDAWGIHIMNADGTNIQRVTVHERVGTVPPIVSAWSPDRTTIAHTFITNRAFDSGITLIAPSTRISAVNIATWGWVKRLCPYWQ